MARSKTVIKQSQNSKSWYCGNCDKHIDMLDNKKLADLKMKLHVRTCKKNIGETLDDVIKRNNKYLDIKYKYKVQDSSI